jgi:hypothetical protein
MQESMHRGELDELSKQLRKKVCCQVASAQPSRSSACAAQREARRTNMLGNIRLFVVTDLLSNSIGIETQRNIELIGCPDGL